MRYLQAGIIGLLLILASLRLSAQHPPVSSGPHPAKHEKTSIILISVDTLRADRLSCYSPNARGTPHIDRLSQAGTLFSQVSSQVPLTLPSHASMLTSTYPFVNGVEDNGDRLAPGSVTLASILRSHGYRTAAFISGFVLNRRFGLDQGFDTYDTSSEMRNVKASDPADIKRPGEEVTKAATHWLNANSSEPFFLFLHIYDLHTPYNLSVEEKAKYGQGYDGELGYVDEVVGQFWEFLVSRGLVDKSLIVFTADHGEGLGEHGESTHGFFIYQSTLHVPLIVHWPKGEALLPTRVDSPASLLDVMPTILSAVRLPIPKSLQGRSLLMPVENARDVYSESVYAHDHFGASALASLRRGHYKYIDAPKPEFFDLAQDPDEAKNLYDPKGAIALAYRERLHGLRQLRQPPLQRERQALSPEAIERLHALGYQTGNSSVNSSSQRQADPKDRIVDYEEYGRAIRLAGLGQLREANVLLEELLNKDPDLQDVRLSLGLNQQRSGKDLEALELFRKVLNADPINAIAHFDAALSYYKLRRFDEAAEELKAAVAVSPDYSKAEELLANILLQKQDYDQARARFNHILQTTPDDYAANYNLGVLAALKNDWEDSVKYLQAALTIEPDSAEAHNTLGSIYVRKGNPEAARGEFEEAIRLKPGYAWAHYNLGLVYRLLSDPQAARSEFQKALAADPEFRAARDALTHLEEPR